MLTAPESYSTSETLSYLTVRALSGNPEHMPEVRRPQPPFYSRTEELLYEQLQLVTGTDNQPASNNLHGVRKYAETLAELNAIPKNLLMPNNEGVVYADPEPSNNGEYLLSLNKQTWEKRNTLGQASSANDANVIKGGHHHCNTLADRNAIPAALRRLGMNVSVWEGASQYSADGKLLPREFKLTGRKLTESGFLIKDSTLFKRTQYITKDDITTVGNISYYVYASDAVATLPGDKYLLVEIDPVTSNESFTDTGGPYDTKDYDTLTKKQEFDGINAETGQPMETVWTYELVNLGRSDLTLYYEMATNTLDLLGTGDQADVWAEVILAGTEAAPATLSNNETFDI
jgi:hypothetical protein